MREDGEAAPFPSTRKFVTGIHPKGTQDGFPINNVGNDKED
jgi:hypothetical protein